MAKTAAKQAKVSPKLAPKAVKKPTSITLRQLSVTLSEKHGLTKKQTTELLGGMVDMIQTNLKKGVTVRIAGLGSLQVRKRAARMGRNPSTGAAIKIKASKKVAFRAAKELKETI